MENNHFKDLFNCLNYRGNANCKYDLKVKYDDVSVSKEEIEKAKEQP